MDSGRRGSSPLLFETLLETLRHHGFDVGVDDHVRVQQLLAGWPGAPAPDQLKRMIAPVVSRSAMEQRRFYALFDELYPLLAPRDGETPEASVEPPVPEAAAELTAPEIPRRHRPWRRARIAAAALLVLGAGSLWLLRREPVPAASPAAAPGAEVAVTRPGAEAGFPVPPPPGPPETESAAAARDPEAEPVVEAASEEPGPSTREPAATEEAAPTSGVEGPRPPPAPEIPRHRWLQLLALGLPLLGLTLFEWRARRRRRSALESHRSRRPPISWDAFPRDVGESPFEPDEVREAARRLRQRQPGETASLSIRETIDATIAARGFPTLRFRAHPRVPEYFALVERSGRRDHQAHLFGELLAELDSEEVPLSRYDFESDPRLLVADEGGRRVLLSEVRGSHDASRLLVFGDGTGFLDPVSGRIEPWVERVFDWDDRALFTPTPPTSWGAREAELADHFVVVPATVEGLAAVVELFDPDTDANDRRWETGHSAPDLAGVREPSVSELESRLSPAAFRWLCVCAVYPELHWGLTLRLAQLPSLGEAMLEEGNILQLVRLPWFRRGRMPDETRLELIGRLPPAVEDEVRGELVRLLSRHPAPERSVAGEDQKIQVALQGLLAARRDRRARREARRELRRFPEETVARDRATAMLVQARSTTPLQLRVPRGLRDRLYTGGLRFFGLRTVARAGIAAVAAIVGIALLEPSPDRAELLAGERPEPPEDCSVFGADYNRSGTCFDEPPTPLDESAVSLTPDFTAVPRASRFAVFVDASGTPTEVSPTAPSDLARFDTLARRRALSDPYLPATRAGSPVAAWLERTFQPAVSAAAADSGAVLEASAAEGPLTLTRPTLSLFEGEATPLGDLIGEGGPGRAAVSWRSLSPEVARVDAAGRLLATAPGRAVLEASTEGGQMATLSVVVEASDVALSSSELYLTPGASASIGVTSTSSGLPLPSDRVSWSSTDEEVARVSDEGEVTGLAWGEAEIVVSRPSGERRIPVTVHPPLRYMAGDPAPGETVTVAVGADRPFQLALLTADTQLVRNVPIEWEVDDPSILSFDPVTYTASGRSVGSTRLIARSREGSVSASWSIDVVAAELRAAVARLDLTVDETARVPLVLSTGEPPPPGAGGARWSSLDTAVVRVAPDGTVVGRGWGRAALVLSGAEGLTDTVQVTVLPSGTFRYGGLLTSGTGETRSVSGELTFAPVAGGTIATVEGCGSQVVTEVDAQFSFDCGRLTLTFGLEPPSRIDGHGGESLGGGGGRTELRRECTGVDERGVCNRWEWRRRFFDRPNSYASGTLDVERVP